MQRGFNAKSYHTSGAEQAGGPCQGGAESSTPRPEAEIRRTVGAASACPLPDCYAVCFCPGAGIVRQPFPPLQHPPNGGKRLRRHVTLGRTATPRTIRAAGDGGP